MPTSYACTHVEKHADVDHPDNGCTGTPKCIMTDRVNFTSPTLSGLMDQLASAYGVELNHIYLTGGGFSVSQLETVAGETPSVGELTRWRDGKLTLYLCDYYFQLDKLEVTDITLVEWESLGTELDGTDNLA